MTMESIADNQITITENGAFIPRSLFTHESEIVETLRKAAEQAMPAERSQPGRPERVEMPDFSREMRWIKEHKREYAGQWVALDGDRLISHGTNAKEVFAAADESGVEDPFFSHLEPADALPFGGW